MYVCMYACLFFCMYVRVCIQSMHTCRHVPIGAHAHAREHAAARMRTAV